MEEILRELEDSQSAVRSELRELRKILLTYTIEEPTEFIQDMELISSSGNDPITIIISSEGGDVFGGISMIRAIRKAQSQGIKVVGSVYGQALSMAFVILQACDERVAGEFDMLMCHGITSSMCGDIKDMKAEQKLCSTIQSNFVRLLSNRSTSRKCDTSYWERVFEDNTSRFYSSQEALELGLIDRIE